MTFNDIFKSSFLENVNSISLLDMGIALVLAFLLGLFIFMIYKKTFSGVMYSSSFGVTLVALTMITTLVILAVTSNVVLSLGMVGALSIVRFRTAIKEPLDIAFLLGLFIFMIYKKTFSGVMYSSSFGVTLIALTMITTLVILAVTSNVVLSLGMVGALSIVRFRTAIKEPLDIAFLFWSIAVGIVLAAGMIPLAVIGSVVIGLMLLVFANKKSHVNPYIVVIRCADHTTETTTMEFLKSKTQRCVVKSKTAQKGEVELNLEIRLKEDNTDFVNDLAEMNGVYSAVLVSYNGDYMG